MHYNSLYPSLPPVPAINLSDFIFSSPVQTDPADKVQIIDSLSGKQWYKNEIRERVYDCATALVAPVSQGGLGFASEGEMVAIMSPNCTEYITLVHSLLRLAIPFSLIPSGATAFELDHLFRVSEASRLFVVPSLLPQALAAAKKFALSEDRVYILEGRVAGRKTLENAIHDVRGCSIARVPSVPVKQDTLAYLVFSSGTSGLPKATMVSHHNVVGSMIQVVVATEFEGQPPPQQHIILGFLPMYHTYGLHYVCLRPVWVGAPVVVIPQWNADLVLDIIPKYRITTLPMTPPAILQLINHRRAREVDLSSVVSAGYGASHLPPKLANVFKSLFDNVAVIQAGFGLSECTISGTRASPGKFGGAKPGSVGVLLPGMEARIVRDDGTLAGPNELGELWLKGVNVVMGYWRNEKATKETFVEGGWLRTGDKFRVDEDQYFFFVEREKDILKVSGSQVSPTEIENALLAYPEKLITDVSVAGVSGGRTSDEKVPRAWIVLSDDGRKLGDKAVIQALDSWIKKSLSKYKWLRGGIEVIGEIPKNATGKVLRRVLQERYEQQLKAKAKL